MMEPLLTINNGNTNITAGTYTEGLDKVLDFKELTNEIKSKTTHVLIANVGPDFEKWNGPKFTSISELRNDNALLEMPINYSKSIGEDRLAGAYWVYKNWIQTKKANRVMLIDAGTFTTLDLITNDGFEGGHIFPGTDTLLKSFSNGTKLPRLRVKEMNQINTIPKDTEEAIYGSIQLAEKGMIEKWWDKFRPEIIILSGGLSFWYEKYLPKEIIKEPNLVHLGLHQLYKDLSH